MLALSDTAQVIAVSKALLKTIYRRGYRYHKAGLMLLDLIPEAQCQSHLFVARDDAKRDRLMRVMDQMNQSMGTGTVFHLAQGTKRDWSMRCDNRSPRYTTKWEELGKVV